MTYVSDQYIHWEARPAEERPNDVMGSERVIDGETACEQKYTLYFNRAVKVAHKELVDCPKCIEELTRHGFLEAPS